MPCQGDEAYIVLLHRWSACVNQLPNDTFLISILCPKLPRIKHTSCFESNESVALNILYTRPGVEYGR